MHRALRKGVLFTLLFAGVVTPVAADPLLMFLLSIARQMAETYVANHPPGPAAPVPGYVPDTAKFYSGTTVEPDQLRRLIDDSFAYLSNARREEIFASLNAAIENPKNAAVRGAMIQYFVERALTVRAAQIKLAQLSQGEKESLAEDFRKEIATLSTEDQTQLGNLLRGGLLPVPSDLNQMLLAAFDGR